MNPSAPASVEADGDELWITSARYTDGPAKRSRPALGPKSRGAWPEVTRRLARSHPALGA